MRETRTRLQARAISLAPRDASLPELTGHRTHVGDIWGMWGMFLLAEGRLQQTLPVAF
jgi:hypothetical protein